VGGVGGSRRLGCGGVAGGIRDLGVCIIRAVRWDICMLVSPSKGVEQ